jgi:hypothetical protein
MLTKVERVAVAKRKLIRSRPLLGCEESLDASSMSVALDPGMRMVVFVSRGTFSQHACSCITAESLWHLPKASNKHDVDLSRMLVDLGHEGLA